MKVIHITDLEKKTSLSTNHQLSKRNSRIIRQAKLSRILPYLGAASSKTLRIAEMVLLSCRSLLASGSLVIGEFLFLLSQRVIAERS